MAAGVGQPATGSRMVDLALAGSRTVDPTPAGLGKEDPVVALAFFSDAGVGAWGGEAAVGSVDGVAGDRDEGLGVGREVWRSGGGASWRGWRGSRS